MEGVDELLKRLNLYEGAKLKPGMTWDNQALDRVLSRLSGTRHPLDFAAWGLRHMFDEDYFRNKLDSSFFPNKAVQPGDGWIFSRKSRKQKRGFANATVLSKGTVRFQTWETRANRLCARLDFQGTEKTSGEGGPETAMAITPVTDGAFAGTVWFAPDSGRAIEVNITRDFTVTSNKITIPVPSAKPPIQHATDYHQIITDKLVSVEETGGSS